MQILLLDFYTLDFLQTINDWQKWTSSVKYRAKLINRLLSLKVPSELRNPIKCCYRVTDFNKKEGRNIIDTGVNEYINFDRITSWTLEYEIAKNFYKAPLKPMEGINYIVKICPTVDDIIINLDTVYSDENFWKACNKLKFYIKRYDKGIIRYNNTQKEIILKPMIVSLDNIFAFGGYSSTKNELMQIFYNKTQITPLEEHLFENLLNKSGAQLGKFWIDKDENPASIKRYIDLLKTRSKDFNLLTLLYPTVFYK